MICSAELSGWGGRILESLDDTTTPTGIVVNWLRNNLGLLNLNLKTSFYISGTGACIVPEMSQNISGIYTQIYICHYLNKKAISNLGAASYDWTEIQGEDQGSIRRVSKNETAKTFRLLAKDCRESLDKLVEWYSGGITPSQILYGNRYGGANYDLLPPPEFCSEWNFVWKL